MSKQKYRKSDLLDTPQQPKKKVVNLSDWNFLKQHRIPAIILFVFSFLLYANTINNDYAIDDSIVITDNEFTKQGVGGLKEIFSTDAFRGFFGANSEGMVEGGRYRPLSMVMFAIEYDLFGPAPIKGDTPADYILKKQKPHQRESHAMNAILYGLTAIVLFILLSYLFKLDSAQGIYFSIPFLATLLFIAHPIHTEAVANIKGRDEIMAFLFSMMTLWMALKYVKTQNIILVISACLFYILALLSKENSITFLAVIPLTMFVFTKAKTNDYVRLVIPFFVLSVIYILLRKEFTGVGLSGIPSQELMNNPFLGMSGSDKFGAIFTTFWKYIQLLFVPHPLTHDYYPFQIPVEGMNLMAILGLITNLGLFIYGIILSRKKDPLGYALLFYFITFSIVSNVLVTIGTNMGERFIYMPSFGFALAIAILLHRLLTSEKIRMALQQRKTVVITLLTILLVGYSAKTFTRNRDWKDNYTLFRQDIDVSPNSAKLQNALGGEINTQADKLEDKIEKEKLYREALEHLNVAIALHPKYSQALLLLGNTHYKLKDVNTSMQFYEKALAVRPGFYDVYFNLGVLYRDAGNYPVAIKNFKLASQSKQILPAYDALAQVYEFAGKKDSAIQTYRALLEKFPDNPNAKMKIGILLGQQNPEEAKKYFKTDIANLRKELSSDKNNIDKMMSLADLYEKVQSIDSAMTLYNSIVSIKPDHAYATYKIGQLWGRNYNNLDKSIEFILKAIALDEKNIVFWEDLGVAYGIKGDIPKAIEANLQLLQINPNYANAYLNLGVSYGILGDKVQSDMYFNKAFEIDPTLRNRQR